MLNDNADCYAFFKVVKISYPKHLLGLSVYLTFYKNKMKI
jgi:hypothetical protein